jgi:putative transposase
VRQVRIPVLPTVALSAIGRVGQDSVLSIPEAAESDREGHLSPRVEGMKRVLINDITIHRRHLPHWQLPGAAYFVTFTLRDKSICDLASANIAPIILDALSFYANKRYFLHDHTIMLDHVHVILEPIVNGGKCEKLGDILGDLKRYTARKINGLLERRGALWLEESYDRIIRDKDDYEEKSRYIFENAVKAGLVERGEDWKWWRPGIPPPRDSG